MPIHIECCIANTGSTGSNPGKLVKESMRRRWLDRLGMPPPDTPGTLDRQLGVRRDVLVSLCQTRRGMNERCVQQHGPDQNVVSGHCNIHAMRMPTY